MKSVLPNYKLFPSNKPIRLYLFSLIAVFTLAGCGSQDKTTTESSEQTLSFKVPDSIQGSKLVGGILTATISVNGGPPQAMTISAGTASITLTGITPGTTDFTLEFTYELAPYVPMIVASDTQTINVIAGGSNTVNFVIADFDTAIHDDDDDGISNLVELDEFSTTSPISCVLGTSELGNCELGS